MCKIDLPLTELLNDFHPTIQWTKTVGQGEVETKLTHLNSHIFVYILKSMKFLKEKKEIIYTYLNIGNL